jgi:hypothetical protein
VTTLQLDISRRERLTEQMLDDLGARVPSVTVMPTQRGWACVLSGAGWETPFGGPTRLDAVQAAHSTFYWPQPDAV